MSRTGRVLELHPEDNELDALRACAKRDGIADPVPHWTLEKYAYRAFRIGLATLRSNLRAEEETSE